MRLCLLFCACRCTPAEHARAQPLAWPAVGEQRILPTVCEASALLHRDGVVLLADNETRGRLYELSTERASLRSIEVGADVDDIEALAGAPGDDLWVVGSQSNNKKAKDRTERRRIVHVGAAGAASVTPDLSICGPCVAVRHLAPKEGGLNVEGAALVGDRLWLGLRSPLIDGKAVLLQMALDAARADDMVLVDLGGEGVREMIVHDGGLLVVSGPLDDRDGPHHLWRMTEPRAAPTRLALDLPSHTEGIAVADARLLWVTDGDGKPGECKTPSRWGTLAYPG